MIRLLLATIISILLLTLVWLVAERAGLPPWLAPSLTTMFLTIAGFFVWRKVKTRRSANEIEKGIYSQAEAHAKSTRPDQQAEVQAMQLQFNEAVQALKSSKLGRGSADALAVLPWYIIVGPPGSGKTTALTASGLNFPFLTARTKRSGGVGGIRGTGGTRNCEWWLCNEAVLIDTAGRYTTVDNDKDEWLSFLDMLARTRSRKPINGMIVAVSIPELGENDECGITALASQVRERIDEVMQQLQIIVPIYLLFTKCDLIPGFVEIFTNLSRNERGQIWGFTVPGKEGSSLEDEFRNQFQELVAVIEKHSMRRLGEEHRVRARERIFQFPQEFSALEQNLTSFVKDLFAENVYQDTPIMRGAYFTSGVQQGRIVDRIMAKMAEAFGIQQSITEHDPAVEVKSFFLTDVFKKVIFPDKNLATRNASAVGQEKLKQYVLVATGAFLALCMYVFPVSSFISNDELVSSTGVIANNARTLSTPTQDPDLAKLDPLRERVELLIKNRNEGAPLLKRFGMYKGNELLPQVKELYAKALLRLLVEPIFRADLAEMEQFAKQFDITNYVPRFDESSRQLNLLKLHLLLTAPKRSDPKELDNELQKFVARQLQERSISLGKEFSEQNKLGRHAKMFAKFLAEDPSLLLARHTRLVQTIRGGLTRDSNHQWQFAIDNFITEAPKNCDITLETIMGGQIQSLESYKPVRGAFTKCGYEEFVHKQLAQSNLGPEPWLLDMDTKDAQATIRSQYFNQYIEEWKSFLNAISMNSNIKDDKQRLQEVLDELTTRTPSLFSRLFSSVADNTRLQAVKTKQNIFVSPELADTFAGFVKFGWAPKTPSVSGAPPPQPLALEQYQVQLIMLREALQNTLNGQTVPLSDQTKTAWSNTRSLINRQEYAWRPLFEKLLLPPFQEMEGLGEKERCCMLQQNWNAQVLPFRLENASLYPFDPNGENADLVSLAEFYHPVSGKLWTFVEESLSGEVRQSGGRFIFDGKRRCKSLQSNLLIFLNRSRDLTNALFASERSELGIEFQAQIQPRAGIETTTLIINGEKLENDNGIPEPKTFFWPSKIPKETLLRARYENRHYQTPKFDDTWGLFRLLEAGSFKSTPNSKNFTMFWNLPGLTVPITINFKPTRNESPFLHSRARKLLGVFRASSVIPPEFITGYRCDR